MISTVERFWIAFILRFAFGFLFLFAAINIFSFGTEKFAAQLAPPMAKTWMGDFDAKVVSLVDPDITKLDDPQLQYAAAVTAVQAGKKGMTVQFLEAMPYIMTALAVCILTGILLRLALRVGALFLVILGLGKYLQNDVATTAADFSFALMICIGLYFLSLQKQKETAPAPASNEEIAAV